MIGFAIEMIALFGGIHDDLDFIPQFARDYGRAIIFDDEIAKMQHADVDGVVEKRYIRIDRVIKFCFSVDLRQAFSCGFHAKGFVDAKFEIWIGIPTMGGALCAFEGFDDDGCADKSERGNAWDCSLFDDVPQTAPGSHRGFVLFLLVGNINDGFNDGTEITFGDFVGERMDDDVSIAKRGFVELSVPCASA